LRPLFFLNELFSPLPGCLTKKYLLQEFSPVSRKSPRSSFCPSFLLETLAAFPDIPWKHVSIFPLLMTFLLQSLFLVESAPLVFHPPRTLFFFSFWNFNFTSCLTPFFLNPSLQWSFFSYLPNFSPFLGLFSSHHKVFFFTSFAARPFPSSPPARNFSVLIHSKQLVSPIVLPG